MKILYKLRWLYLFGLFLFFLVNCNPLKIFGVGSSEISSLIPIDGLNTSHIPNESFFYINIRDSHYVGDGFDGLQTLIYAMDFGPGTDCKIQKPEDPEEGSTEDLYCIMDMMEGDMWFHEIVLEFNVPPEMCDYIGIDVPWHFNQRVGEGPRRVYERTDYRLGCTTNDGGDLEAEVGTRYCLEGYTVGATDSDLCGQETITTGCVGAGPMEAVTDFCRDLDQSENDLANCCLGDYNLVTMNGEITESNWGGNLQNCIGGLGRISWEDYSDRGLPIKRIESVRNTGFNEPYEIPALIEIYDGYRGARNRMRAPTFITANYWTDAEDKDSATSKPRFYTPPTSFQLPREYLHPVILEGHPYLTLSCMNHAYERKHRIHLLIREWNTQEEFNRFVESEGSRGDPDVAGEEGSFCEYYEGDEETILPQDTQCNDSFDADDWNNVDPGTGRGYNAYPQIIYN
ncbi:MAG: hypothetical protein OXM55_08605 [Bdellovibrionales bacterium]|nr:hypothetical protein [Bdellovibrionales bacterium]